MYSGESQGSGGGGGWGTHAEGNDPKSLSACLQSLPRDGACGSPWHVGQWEGNPEPLDWGVGEAWQRMYQTCHRTEEECLVIQSDENGGNKEQRTEGCYEALLLECSLNLFLSSKKEV